MSTEGLILFGIISFFTAILSGISGGGGGFITTPLAIFLGLTPQQAIATGKVNGLAISLGSLHGFRKAKLHNWRIVIPIMVLAAVIGLLAPFFITRIDNDSYRKLLGAVLLLMIPVLFFHYKNKSVKEVTPRRKTVGYILLAVTLSLQAVFSSGMGTLVNVALMACMGMSALEATVTKRFSQVVMNGLIIIGVVLSGLVVWQVAAVSVAGSFVGGQIGAHIALKKGEEFITIIFAVIMFVSGLELLFG